MGWAHKDGKAWSQCVLVRETQLTAVPGGSRRHLRSPPAEHREASSRIVGPRGGFLEEGSGTRRAEQASPGRNAEKGALGGQRVPRRMRSAWLDQKVG